MTSLSYFKERVGRREKGKEGVREGGREGGREGERVRGGVVYSM